ncbi:MAG: ribosome-associated translation inhibitor RaiA [bacterium]
MKVIIRGHGIDVTAPLRDYAEKKFSKLEEFFGNIQKAEVTLEVRKIENQFRNQVAEITVWTAGKIVRATDGASDMYAAIDQVLQKIERQIEKHKEKLVHEVRRQSGKAKGEIRKMINKETKSKEPTGSVIVKVKRFAMTPMMPEEAAQQMEALGHDFYMFLNSKTEEVNTIYRRRSGNYGLIEPELQ